MAFDREAAKQAGYTDEEIDAFLQAQSRQVQQATPAGTDATEPPPPTTKITPVETSAGAVATTVGLGVAPYVGTAALGAGGVYGANVIRQGIAAARENAAARMLAEQGIQNRFEQRMAQQAAPKTTGPGYSNVRYNVPTQAVPGGQPVPNVSGPVSPTNAPMAGTAPAQPMQQPSMLQRGMDVASRMRQMAAQRVMPAAASAAVPAAVGAGGAALSNTAAQQLARMTPEQRRQFYSSPMMGAMSGDAGFAAAIMNAGQY